MPGKAPFDAILVGAAANYIPPALKEQLRPGGRMILPVVDSDSSDSESKRQFFTLVDRNMDGSFMEKYVTVLT